MMIIFFLALLIYLGICAVLVALILMQEGKGGGLSGVMGSSMGETFGFGGASKQVRKYTAICAGIFMVMTIILTFLGEAALTGSASDFIGTDSTPAATVPAPVAVTPAVEPATPGLPPEMTPSAPPALIVGETPIPQTEEAPETEGAPGAAPVPQDVPEQPATTPAPEAAPDAAPETEATPEATPEP